LQGCPGRGTRGKHSSFRYFNKKIAEIYLMKTLILVRHAKSSWDAIGLEDYERPLNERGKEDAPAMAKRLRDKKIKVDVFISSPAKRAHKTARYFAKEYGLDKKDVVLEDRLYGASAAGFSEVVSQIKNKHKTAVIFSHNPGLTEFANTLTSINIDNMPTSSIFAVEADCKKWADFNESEKKFLFFDYPKKSLE
jgi:phosphohistidine phosphatase